MDFGASPALYGDPQASHVAGLSAAIVAGAQILGGAAAPRIRRLFRQRASALTATAALSAPPIGMIGAVESFWGVIALTTVWALLFAATSPIRQAYLNDMIPSSQRATTAGISALGLPFLAVSRRRAARDDDVPAGAVPTPQPA
jgi:MFS family permease